MASVYLRGEKWYARFKGADAKWRSIATAARTKTEAKRMAGELERRAERQRLGLEPITPEDGGGTLGELLSWWLTTYVKGTPSFERTNNVVRKNFLDTELAKLRLTEVTAGRLEVHLQSRASELSGDSLNHLRSFLLTAYNRARQAGRWHGPNPVRDVRRRKVPRRLPDFLKVDEVPRVLAVLAPHHRWLFAAAIFTGCRKGELAGLRKSDIDLNAGLINVCRSYDQDTTKGGRAAAIPIAQELRPHLEAAIAASPSDLVFPGVAGRMMTTNTPLEEVLRRALARAGIVIDFTHVCRKKDCGHAEQAPDGELRHCPEHGYKLWPKANVRKIRFHDLRHTTASLLMMAGANPAAVQRILRHSDPRITTEVYGHLVPGYLQEEVDRLRFGPVSPSSDSQVAASALAALVTNVLQAPANDASDPDQPDPKLVEFPLVALVGHSGLEPEANGLREGCTKHVVRRPAATCRNHSGVGDR